jgi:membrane-associated protease RseP (regulator of RpoE activity)
MLKAFLGCCRFFPCVTFIFLALPTHSEVRSFAEESPEKLAPDDISIGEPLQIPLHSGKEVLSAKKGSETTDSSFSPREELIPQNRITTESEDKKDKKKKNLSETVTVLSNGQEKTDDNSTKKNSSKNKQGPQGSGWLGLIVDDSIITGRLVIVKVSDLSPAMQAGIKAQDVLLAIDGEPVQTADQLAALLAAIPPDKQVRALIGRTEGVNEVTMTARTRPPVSRTPAQVPLSQLADSRGLSASKNEASRFTQSPTHTDGSGTPVPPPSVTVPPSIASTRPEQPETNQSSRFSTPNNAQPTPASQAVRSQAPAFEQPPAIKPSGRTVPDNYQGRTALGVRTLPIDSATQTRYRLPSQTGAYVFGVVQSLPASNAGLPPGSVIVAFDNRPVRSPDELNHFVRTTAPGTLVSLQYVLPGGQSRQTNVALQSINPALEQALIGVPANDLPPDTLNTQTVRRRLPEPADSKLLQKKPENTAAKPVLLETEIQLLREEILQLRIRIEMLEQSDHPDKKRQYRKLL